MRNTGIYKLCIAVIATGFALGILNKPTACALGFESLASTLTKPVDGENRSINEAFRSPEHWRGADGAMSVELSPIKTLWLFGDTWIYCESKTPRPDRNMINNSVAIQTSNCDAEAEAVGSLENVCIDSICWSFWCKGKLSKPESIFQATEPNSYYWPGCGTVYDGKLYLLLKKIRKKDDPNPLFQFDWYADDLLIVSNPQDPPIKWTYTIFPVSTWKHEVEYGLACSKDKDFLYSLCFLNEFPKTTKKTILARIAWKDLLAHNTQKWEYWSSSERLPQGAWQADFRNVKNIIPDCGPEASLFFHKGLKCFVAVYQPPLSPQVKFRVSRKIEGPWSEALNIFTVPERRLKDGKTALTYAAKAHESLSTGNTIGFSYCENPGGIEQHIANPDVYFPTVRTFTIAPEKVREMLDGAGSPKPKP